MKSFYGIIQWIIFLVLASSAVLVFSFGEQLILIDKSSQYAIIALLVVAQFMIINFVVVKFYQKPILNLEYMIKSFLTGRLKDKDIKLERNLNPNLDFVLRFFNKTLNTLKNIKDEFLHGKEIKWEVELGKEIQGKMLTKKLINVPSLDIIVKSKPAGEIGWDSYDIINVGDNYYIYVWDATGHGVGAGFIMIMVNALVSAFSKVYKSGAAILAKTNEVLKPRVKANLLMSMLMVRWDEKEKRLFMTGAGHEYLMIYKHKQNKCFKVKSGWVALGMIKDITKLLKEQEISFEPNDIIVLYSDGITEAINQPKKDGNEEMFGEQRLINAIERSPNIPGGKYKSSRSVFNNITIELSQFMWYKHVQLDDVTLATIHYKTPEHNSNKDYAEDIGDDFITERSWED